MAKKTPPKQKILQQAERQFALYGYEGTKLEEVGQKLGIGRSAVLYHFPRKHALYQAVLDDAMQPLLRRVQRVLVGDGKLRERLNDMLDVMLEECAARPSVPLILVRELMSEKRARIVGFSKEFRSVFGVFYEAALEAGEINEGVSQETFTSMLFGPLMYFYLIPLTREEAVDTIKVGSNEQLGVLLKKVLLEDLLRQ